MRRLDDPGEIVRIERSAPYQRAIDVALSQQLGGIRSLDRTAVLNTNRRASALAGDVRHHGADRGTHRLRVLRCRIVTGADGPNRLVGDDQPGDLFLLQAREATAHLTAHAFFGRARFALLE